MVSLFLGMTSDSDSVGFISVKSNYRYYFAENNATKIVVVCIKLLLLLNYPHYRRSPSVAHATVSSKMEQLEM